MEESSAAAGVVEAFANWGRGYHLWVVPVGWLVVVAGHMLTTLAVYCLWFGERLAASLAAFDQVVVD